MKITKRKNDYGHDVVDCPFCDAFAYAHGHGFATNKDELGGLKRHILVAAKNEAFEWALSDGTNGANKHLEYVRAHTSLQPMRTAPLKRQFDKDLSL